MVRRYTDLLESSLEGEETNPEVSNQPSSSSIPEEGEDHSFGDYISK